MPSPGRTATGSDPHAPLRILYEGYTVLVARRDGSLQGGGREGLWDYDTRILAVHRIRLDGRIPEYASGGAADAGHGVIQLRLPRTGGDARGPLLPQDAFEVLIERRVGRGMEERLTVHNHSMTGADVELALELDADFIDVQEAGRERLQHGRIEVFQDPGGRELRLDYHATRNGRELHRALRIRVIASDSTPTWAPPALRFRLHLPPRGRWSATLGYYSLVDGVWREPLPETPGIGTPRDEGRRRWLRERTHIEASHPLVASAFERAAEDLFALRNWEYDDAPDAWFPMAGVPTYTGVFGRDSLTAGWQAALLGPPMMRGALAVAAETQATADVAWRDEEPGKLIHEIRRGPLSELDIIPQRAYYGTQTTPAMFVLALSELWHWTGDDDALRRYRDAALRTFEWAARYGDRDGDGFLEYTRRSPRGLKNHAWKDSDEAIRYPDGTMVENPIATVEEQAYHFIALQRMAEILIALGEDARAAEFIERARTLKHRWHDAFWLVTEGFYAMALDPEKRPVRSIGSNAGHALGAGIVPRERARAVADRLMAPDLFSGWGVRTLSTEHPSYNPIGYHLGTVWPVENATFALGFKRYGLDEHVERLASGLLAAAAHFPDFRLPEALGGHARDDWPIPTLYPGSNSPQAWSASATVQLVQILLGLYPFAPAKLLLLVRPRLPDWLDTVTVHRLRVGDAAISLRFRREEDGTTSHDVLERHGTLHLLTVPPPDDVREPTWLDAFKDWALEHAPGRLAAAARIALGEMEG
ncbi:MAG TPA: glycogen debranching N-terminal domain-containing protein [Longimicrobiales bacterium]